MPIDQAVQAADAWGMVGIGDDGGVLDADAFFLCQHAADEQVGIGVAGDGIGNDVAVRHASGPQKAAHLLALGQQQAMAFLEVATTEDEQGCRLLLGQAVLVALKGSAAALHGLAAFSAQHQQCPDGRGGLASAGGAIGLVGLGSRCGWHGAGSGVRASAAIQ